VRPPQRLASAPPAARRAAFSDCLRPRCPPRTARCRRSGYGRQAVDKSAIEITVHGRSSRGHLALRPFAARVGMSGHRSCRSRERSRPPDSEVGRPGCNGGCAQVSSSSELDCVQLLHLRSSSDVTSSDSSATPPTKRVWSSRRCATPEVMRSSRSTACASRSRTTVRSQKAPRDRSCGRQQPNSERSGRREHLPRHRHP